MIFTDNRITDKNVNVRFYEYYDKEKGYGDAGTKMYAIFPLSAFVEKENLRDKSIGGSYFTYEFTKEWYEKLKKTFGDYWHIDYSYSLTDEKKREEELAEAMAIMKLSMTTKKFL